MPSPLFPNQGSDPHAGSLPRVQIKALSIQGTPEALLLDGGVRVSYGDCVLQTPQAHLSRLPASKTEVDCMSCPSATLEWLSTKQKMCRLDCSGPCDVLFAEGRAIMTATEGERLHWTDEEHRIEACRAVVSFDPVSGRLQVLDLEEDVRLFRLSREDSQGPTQLWAERARVQIPENVILLSAAAPRSVMVWNRGASQELACHRLRIWKESLTQQWIQEADGDVRVFLAGDTVHQITHARVAEDEDENDDTDF